MDTIILPEMAYKYKFTIFTPCYNSALFIHRVYDSLVNQIYRDFEWIVINDASTDNTSDIIKEYVKKAPFDIQFIDLNINQMVTKNINMAIRKAQGEMLILIGHDDAFLPDSLQIFEETWRQYGRSDIAGITCLCQDQQGNTVGKEFEEDIFISNDRDLLYNKKNTAEKWKCLRTDVMLQYLQPENIDIYIPEGVMPLEIAEKYSMIYINRALRVYYMYESTHSSLSAVFSKSIPYPKGFRYAYLQKINKVYPCLSNKYVLKVRTLINYGRMSFHAKIPIRQIIMDLQSSKNRFLCLCLIGLEYSLYQKDIRRQKKGLRLQK